MSSKDQVIALLQEYINSYSEANNFLGNDTILQRVKTGYEALTIDDRADVQTQFKALEDKAIPQKEKIELLNKWTSDALVGATVGAAATGGAALCFKAAALKWAAGGCLAGAVGTFFYSHLSDPDRIYKLNRRLSPYTQLSEVLGLGHIGTRAYNTTAHQKSVEVKGQDGLRRRRR